MFTLPDSVESIPEYLCHEGALLGVGKRFGFVPGYSACFDEAVVRFAAASRYQEVGRKMGGNGLGEADEDDALDTANLYRIAAYAFTPAAHATFNVALAS